MNITATTNKENTSEAKIEIVGRVDSTNANRVGDFFESILMQGYLRYVIDLSQTDYVSSAGLRELAFFYKKCRAQSKGIKLLVVERSRTGEVLDLSGLASIIPIEFIVPAALGAASERFPKK